MAGPGPTTGGNGGGGGCLGSQVGVFSAGKKVELFPTLLNATFDTDLQSNVLLDKWASSWGLKIN